MWRVTRDVWRDICSSRHSPLVTRHLFLAINLAAGWTLHAAEPSGSVTTNTDRVIMVENAGATVDFQPVDAIVQQMVDHAVTSLTHETNVITAWRSIVS